MSVPKFGRYTVYRNKDDRHIITDGTAEEAAKAMGISITSFYSTVTRVRNGENQKWYIETLYDGISRKPPKKIPKRQQKKNLERRRAIRRAEREARKEATD